MLVTDCAPQLYVSISMCPFHFGCMRASFCLTYHHAFCENEIPYLKYTKAHICENERSAQVSDGSRTVSGQPTLPFDSCSDQKFLITNNLPINNSPIFQARCQRKMRRAHYLRELWMIPVISLRIGSSDLNVVLHLFANEWCELRLCLVGKKILHSIRHIESLGTCMEH